MEVYIIEGGWRLSVVVGKVVGWCDVMVMGDGTRVSEVQVWAMRHQAIPSFQCVI